MGAAGDPSLPDFPFPVAPGEASPHPTRLRVAIYKAPETKTEHVSRDEDQERVMNRILSEAPRSPAGAGVESRFPDLYPQQNLQHSLKLFLWGPGGGGEQLEKNAVQPVI